MNKETLGVLVTFLDALQNWHLTLIIKTPEWRYWHCSGVFIINLEKISVHCSVVSLVYFEQVNSGCVHGSTKKWTYIFLLYWNCIWTNNKQSAIAEGTLHKKCPYSEFFWSSFSGFRTEYGDSPSIQFECGKIQTRKTLNMQWRWKSATNNLKYWLVIPFWRNVLLI